ALAVRSSGRRYQPVHRCQCCDVILRGGAGASCATPEKFAASSLLPVPFHRATRGYIQRGRVRSTLPFVTWDAISLSGATFFSTHCSSAPIASNWFGPAPPAEG